MDNRLRSIVVPGEDDRSRRNGPASVGMTHFRSKCSLRLCQNYEWPDSTPEVLPASRLQFDDCPGSFSEGRTATAGDFTDFGDLDSGDPVWNTCAGGSGEEQFVVFSAVQGKVKIDLAAFIDSRAGDCLFQDFRPATALLADMRDVCGQAVAKINH